MSNLKSKLTSRKFWVSVAAFLASFGTAIAGVVIGEYSLAGTGAVCTAISAGIYAASEAYVDGHREASNTTSTNTNFNASANNAEIVKDAISNK